MAGSLLDRASVRLALYGALALTYVHPALADAAKLNEFRDSEVLMLYERAAVDTVRRFGELPLWNPYYCGGFHALGAPQVRVASPTFLVSLLLGAERAEIVIVFLLAVLGMEGVYRWLRSRSAPPAAAVALAPVFALSGHFAVSFLRGWTNFFGFELVPWILFGLGLAARGRVAGVAIASIAFAVILGFGGTFAAPLIAVAAIVESLIVLGETPARGRRRALEMLAATAALMTTVACVRLWPLVETLAAAPRIMAGTPGNETADLVQMLIGAPAPKDGDVETVGTFYVGASFLVLTSLGLISLKGLKRLVATALFMLLATGYATKPSLFGLLRHLPVFSEIRYPERFLWIAILFGCEAAAQGVGTVARFLGERRMLALCLALGVVGSVAPTVVREVSAFERAATGRELVFAGAPSVSDFRQSRGNRWLAAHYEAAGIGSLACWETHAVAMSPLLRSDLPAEEYLADPTAGTVRRIAWSPTEIAVDANVPRGGRLLVNQNWHPGWRASVGDVVSSEGLLAVDLPPGRHTVTLDFRPWSAWAGAGVSMSALIALALLGLRARRGRLPFTRGTRLTTAAIVAFPLLLGAAALRASPERAWVPAPPTNANGTPALAIGLEGAEPLHATFTLPVVVEGGRVSGPDALANLAIDVYLRRTGPMPRATLVLVQLERREGQPPSTRRMNVATDHQVVGGSFYLSEAPAGQLVHDAFGMHVENLAPGTWDVFVGFGEVPSSQRARVGTFTVR